MVDLTAPIRNRSERGNRLARRGGDKAPWLRNVRVGSRETLPGGAGDFHASRLCFAGWMKPLKPLTVAH